MMVGRLLDTQAFPFRQAGLDVIERLPDRIRVDGEPHPIDLSFRVQRMLLGRIRQLQADVDVPASDGPGQPCSLRLVVTASRERRYRWTTSARDLTDLCAALRGPAVDALARTIDLTSFTVTWCPRATHWRLRVEPYAASHLRVYFPPVNYSTTLHPPEASTIAAALREAAGTLSTSVVRPARR
ncbi:DUF3156 family protein [Phytoactinopolyspora limicola]|uniref:DUF3156 family protein n=1 Tax=Phytoactinopolyspora limicola TaxID=2715536 RepID=UPI00140BFE2B|nr:DUF3156 family protein [Phytoactinopolyspora limicola]